jgi:hypothetical protein
VAEPLAYRDSLRRRIVALPPLLQAVFALACAEHLVSLEASPRQATLRAAIDRGFEQLAGESGDLAALHAALSGREDVDDDEVAAVVFALGAVLGRPNSAWWTADRSLDAAYDRAPHPVKAAMFRPLEDDTADPSVQQEISWQTEAVKALENGPDWGDIAASLRS